MEEFVRIIKGLDILRRRLKEQGVGTTMLWAMDHVVRRVTGAPIEQVSRITPLLHVGGQYKKRGWPLLQQRGIGAVVNLRIEFDDMEAGIAPEKYLHLPTVDDNPLSREHLEKGAAFIQDCMDENTGVYIHCKSGVGRAPSMAVGYFISTGMSFTEARQKVSAGRPFIRMMPGQVAVLQEYAESREAAAETS